MTTFGFTKRHQDLGKRRLFSHEATGDEQSRELQREEECTMFTVSYLQPHYICRYHAP